MKINARIDAGKLKNTFANFEKAHKIAKKNMLNITAFGSRKNAINIIKQDFTLRSSWTVRSVRVDKSETGTDASKVGSVADYMITQQEGDIKDTVAIGRKAARLGGMNTRISKSYYLRRIKRNIINKNVRHRGTKKSNSVARAYIAWKHNKYIKKNDRIFKVESFKRSGRGNVNYKTKLLYTIHDDVKIKGNKWLTRAVEKPSSRMSKTYEWQLRKLWKDMK
jgi:hypothetical protein